MTTVAQQYTAKWRPIIEPIASKYGINPDFVLTQMAHESMWGNTLPTGSHNYAGITETRKGVKGVKANDSGKIRRFRKFENDQAFAEFYVDMLARLYPGTTTAKTIDEFSAALQDGKRKYAESPSYKAALATVYNDHYADGSANETINESKDASSNSDKVYQAQPGLADYTLAMAQQGYPVGPIKLSEVDDKDPYAALWGVKAPSSPSQTAVTPSRGPIQRGGNFEYIWGLKK